MNPYDEITPEEAFPRLGEFLAVDVRREHEFHGPLGHVAGSILVPLHELEARVQALPTDRPLLLVCRSGGRSGKACEQLEALGIGPVLNLAGGMIAWNRAGLSLEHPEPGSLGELIERVVAWVAQVTPLQREAVTRELREQLAARSASFDDPTHAAIDVLLDFVEELVDRHGGAADLDLSLTSFRRSLAVL